MFLLYCLYLTNSTPTSFFSVRHVKTSSPLVISTMLVGVAGHIPYCIIEGIILSGTRYSLNEHLGTVLCQVRKVVYIQCVK